MTTTLTPETLYSQLEGKTHQVNRVGLRETLFQLDHAYQDRQMAAEAVREIYSCAQQKKVSASDEATRDKADIISCEAIEAAYQLDVILPPKL